ncbi:hypothetical protein H8356DRAFT_1681829 [Neocallimastix lanati (nom. inval.)]|nr:hypothetical protein H8356DRAFT_1681829 [Neocallimastix sp. JGI-2020a]
MNCAVMKNLENKKKKIKTKTDEINILIEKYKNKEAKLIDIKYDRSDLTKLWFECLTNLNNIL